MGVRDLWSIVGPVQESVPLYSLTGKTLAVDLSLWVCEAQHVHSMVWRGAKCYLRVSSLTLMGIKLVFVMEGEAPKLKAETMRKRTEMQFGGFKKAPKPAKIKGTDRKRFKAVLRECAEMLDGLGIPWVTAAGEAEAMCAYLDCQGLVDGCITNDGDAFLYGAKTVYRNFNMNTKDPLVDCYRMSRVQTELHLSRENLVGLAILLGCDYIPKGIPGVGKEQALKLIQMLKGQTLLQRFHQWKDENPCVSEGAVKNVSHCVVCHHPGSAKAHERGGCLLCDSHRFCQPQDFDYQCPCDWHRGEHERQASAVEASVRKNTLVSAHFPFTEIISEFLVSKDKPVTQFNRRKPNLLSMQKTAFYKMEWPRHYTSKKVLVLLTYTALINRINRSETSSEIKPLRILKHRVQNGIACLEVVWSTPAHYVFPEDQPAESRDEVRTVEEESLFRLAYPHIVERYLSDKALAQENKTKKKKTKSKKKSPGSCDGISDLLARVSLQSSISSNSNTQTPAPQPVITMLDEPEIVLLDVPEPQGQLLGSGECFHSLEGLEEDSFSQSSNKGDSPASQPSGRSISELDVCASPLVSAVINALHLSDMEWESFTSSPPPNHSVREATDSGVRERNAEDTKKQPQADTVAHMGSQPDLEMRSLRERVLMRNMVQSVSQMETPNDAVTKQLNYESHSPVSMRGNNSNKPSERGTGVDNKKFPPPVTKKTEQPDHVPKPLAPLARAQRHANDTSHDTQIPKYKFVKGDSSSLSMTPQQRCHSDPGQSSGDSKARARVPPSTKRSVCVSLCSSSEDSGAENENEALRHRRKVKNMSKLVKNFKLKPTSATNSASQHAKLFGPKARSKSEDVGAHHSSVPKSPDPPCAGGCEDVFIPPPPSSPVAVSDSDGSVSCSESPLPLAERLRLKSLI